LIHLYSNILLLTTEPKHLGVFTDAKLNWKAHILHLTSSTAQGVGVFYKIRKYHSKHVQILYNTFIKSKLSYALTL